MSNNSPNKSKAVIIQQILYWEYEELHRRKTYTLEGERFWLFREKRSDLYQTKKDEENWIEVDERTFRLAKPGKSRMVLFTEFSNTNIPARRDLTPAEHLEYALKFPPGCCYLLVEKGSVRHSDFLQLAYHSAEVYNDVKVSILQALQAN